MDEIRAGIDAIDVLLVDLLAERAAYIDRAWRLKARDHEKALVQWRVDDVLAKVRARAEKSGLSPQLAEELWRRMMDWFIRYEAEHLD
jgi:isochorismate pyruvate lyase